MNTFTQDQLDIEKKESSTLLKLNSIFSKNLKLFNNNLQDSINYMFYISLPVIMASIEKKSYNPFSEIIEKNISYIINKELLTLGYKMLPLGYSSDLSFENEKFVINIDIKTANIKNPQDFNKEIALGFNQTSYPGRLPLGIRSSNEYSLKGIDNVKVNPFLPVEYTVQGKKKLNLTYGLIFIYPDYKEIIDSIRKEYLKIRGIINSMLPSVYKDSFKNEENFEFFLNHKTTKSKSQRRKYIIDNLIRAYFVGEKRDLSLNDTQKNILEQFGTLIKLISDKLIKREIKPVAIISISIPNGKLVPHYDDQIVSGKDFGESIRYHYNEGRFKGLRKKSRVIFIYKNSKYETILRKYFGKILYI